MKRDRERNGITAGLLLIGLGILMLTDWWWPGIMVVLGLSVGAGLVFRGRYVPAAIVLIIFLGIPVIIEMDALPWDVFAPMVLIGLGIIVLAKAFVLRDVKEDVKGRGGDVEGK